MPFDGKVVLFVEGSTSPTLRGGRAPLDILWREHLVKSLGLVRIDRIVTISKKDIGALDLSVPLSGVGSFPIDERIRGELQRAPFDAAIIAWDLQPPWNPTADTCRWNECVGLFAGLSRANSALPAEWREYAMRRYNEMRVRRKASARLRAVRLEKPSIITVCMEPTFEGLLIQCERTIRDTLGYPNHKPGWPTWDAGHSVPEDLLQSAIEATQRVRPAPEVTKRIRGDMKTAKNEWAEYLLRQMVNDAKCLEAMKKHPIAKRLIESLSA